MVLNRVKKGLKADFRLEMITGRWGEMLESDFIFFNNGSENIFFICILVLNGVWWLFLIFLVMIFLLDL